MVVNSSETSRELTTINNKAINLKISGAGQAELALTQQPGGKVVALHTLTVSGTNLGSEISLTTTEPNGLSLDSISLGGSLRQLNCPLDVGEVSGSGVGFVLDAQFGEVTQLNAPGYRFIHFTADGLGDAAATGLQFSAAAVMTLDVHGDVRNITLLAPQSNNLLLRGTVDGVVSDSTLYGAIWNFEVKNTNNADVAMDRCSLVSIAASGLINAVNISQGDMVQTTIGAIRGIGQVILSDGDMTGCQIDGTRRVGRVYVSGNMDDTTSVSATGNGGRIEWVICGGNCGATLNAGRISHIETGFDNDRKRRAENETFTGGDFTGTASSTYGIGEVNATGKISGATMSASFGIVNSVFAEDGFENSTINAAWLVKRLMVGYLDGWRGHVQNADADVSGTINTRYLGRIYYTGQLDPNTTIPDAHGPIVDDRP